MNTIINEIANVGLTILIFGIAMFVIQWLDKNIFNKKHKGDK